MNANTIGNLLTNKTSMIGITSIIGLLVHLIFGIVHGTATEGVWTASLSGMLTGMALVFSANQKDLNTLADQVDRHEQALQTGDTTLLAKPGDAANQTKGNMKVPLLLAAGLSLALFTPSCAYLKPAPLAANADAVEVRAEQSIAIAADTFDELLKLEYNNIDLVRSKAPAIHQFCEYMRQPTAIVLGGTNVTYARDIALIASVTEVRRAYKANRSPSNKANLVTGLASLEAALIQAQGYLTTLGTIKPIPVAPPPPHAPGAWLDLKLEEWQPLPVT